MFELQSDGHFVALERALRFLRKSEKLRMPIIFVEVAACAAGGSVEDTAGSTDGSFG